MTDPTDPTGADQRADADWFRQHVDPVLDATPVADGWGAIEAGVLAQPAPRSATARRQRWLAAAAVLVILAVTAAVVAAVRGDGPDDSDTVHAGGAHPDGWYVPVGLPAGWRLQSAVLTEGAPCDGASQRWKTLPEHAEDDGTRPALELRYHSCGTLPETPGVPGPALGSGAIPSFVGPSSEDASWEVVRWEDDGLWELTGEGTSGDRLLAAAEAVVTDPESEAPPLPELDRTGGGSWQDVRPGSTPGVTLVLASPEDERVEYQLVDSGEGPALTSFTSDEAHPLPAQPLTLRRRGSVTLDRLPGGAQPTGYLFGAWPGADVLVPERVQPAPGSDRPPSAAEARAATGAVAGSLRRATTEEWRAFLTTAVEPVTDPALLTASSLATLDAAPSSTTSAMLPDGPAATTTTAPGTDDGDGSTTASDGPVISDPGVSRPSERPSKVYSSLDGLAFRFELGSDTISAGQPVPGTLVVRNTTDRELVLNECTVGLIQWGLVPADDPEADPPPRDIIDCYDDPVVTVPANSETRRPLDPSGVGFRAQRAERATLPLGTLPGGDYLAVVEVPGEETTVRATIPVDVPEPSCPTSDALAKRYLDLSSDQAADRAEASGLAYRAVRIDGEPQVVTDDLRCDRINVDLSNDRVTNVLRY